jgi:hypothetical protein
MTRQILLSLPLFDLIDRGTISVNVIHLHVKELEQSFYHIVTCGLKARMMQREKMAIHRQRKPKHVSASTNQHATME